MRRGPAKPAICPDKTGLGFVRECDQLTTMFDLGTWGILELSSAAVLVHEDPSRLQLGEK
jgi:hypothetical protein